MYTSLLRVVIGTHLFARKLVLIRDTADLLLT